jgi:uridine phosphorylase
MAAPIHLHPTAELAPRVLLPGDPGRALLLAQALIDAPRMFNHHRGLWGYTGAARADGEPLTIQATGMGGPSAAIVVSELADLGAEQVIRVGTCGALAAELALGDLVVVEAALGADGTSRALGAPEQVAGDPALTAALRGDHRGLVVTTDLFYDPDVERQEGWVAAGALAVEMECAAVLAVASARGIAGAAVLLVSDLVLPARRRIEPDALRAGEERLGAAALAALAG